MCLYFMFKTGTLKKKKKEPSTNTRCGEGVVNNGCRARFIHLKTQQQIR